jgi:DNA polymerase III alpha subunit (gram-positive type)
MNYLFFDIECAKCEGDGKGFICEFGYVITDENFNVIDTEEWLINPNHEFDWYAKYRLLSYKEDNYKRQAKFPKYYNKIAKILEQENQVILGHTTKFDFGYINFECELYKLEKIELPYYDICIPFKQLRGERQDTSLKNMLLKLEIERPGKLHNAQNDAMATMMVCKKLCEEYHIAMEGLIKIQAVKKNLMVNVNENSNAG